MSESAPAPNPNLIADEPVIPSTPASVPATPTIAPQPITPTQEVKMPQSFDTAATIAQLVGDEAERFVVYDDANGQPIRAGTTVVGNPTIGIGRNVASKGLSAAESSYLCQDDVAECAATLDAQIPWWRNLSPVRQQQMVNLDFNMGWGGLVEFHNFLAAMEAGEWQEAVNQLQASKWWGEVGKRGPEIAGYILAG